MEEETQDPMWNSMEAKHWPYLWFWKPVFDQEEGCFVTFNADDYETSGRSAVVNGQRH